MVPEAHKWGVDFGNNNARSGERRDQQIPLQQVDHP